MQNGSKSGIRYNQLYFKSGIDSVLIKIYKDIQTEKFRMFEYGKGNYNLKI